MIPRSPASGLRFAVLLLALSYLTAIPFQVARSSPSATSLYGPGGDAPPARALSGNAPAAQSGDVTTIRPISLVTKDLVVDPNTQTVYASVPGAAGAIGNSVTTINPSTASVGASVFIGSEPSDLAISDDGRVIYAALDGANSVRRFDVATQTAGLQFEVGKNQFGQPYPARQIKVAPGANETVAVQSAGSQFDAPLFVFDNGVRRGSPLPSGADYLDFSASATRLYTSSSGPSVMGGIIGLQKISLTPTGPAGDGNSAQVSTRTGEIRFAAGRLYAASGNVYDPETGAVLGTFSAPDLSSLSTVVPDSSVGRVYFVSPCCTDASGNTTLTLRAFDMSTFQQVGSVIIGVMRGTPTSLTRWGANGLVFRTDTTVFIIQTTLVPSGEPVPTQTPTPSPTPTPTPPPVSEIRQLSLPAKDLVVDPNSQTIYASVPSSAGAAGNSVTPINPLAGTVGTPVPVGSEPGKLAVSDDGQFIYVALDGAAAVRRFDVATQAAGPQFSLGSVGSEGPVFVRDIAVMPGSPHTVAVARRISSGFSPDTQDAAIYDDGTQRPQVEPSSQGSFWVEFSGSPSLLYGLASDGLHRMTVGPSGITQLSSITAPVAGDFKFDGGLIYSGAGQVIDPASGSAVGVYTGAGGPNGSPNLVVPDSRVNRVFFLSAGGLFDDSVNKTATVLAFDQHTFRPVGSITVAGVNGRVGGFARWGANGLAFGTTGGQVFLIRTTLVPSSDPVPTPTPTPSPTPTSTPTPAPTPAPGEFRQLTLPAKDLVVDPNTQTLYVSNGSDAGSFSNSITPVDPASGQAGTPAFVGDANRMAISGDGQVIYVGIDNAHAVRRFDVATRTAGSQFPLNSDTGVPTFTAQDLSVMPGNPGVVAVARANLGSGGSTSGGVAIYDNGAQRPGLGAGGTSVQFSPSPSVLYSYNGLDSDRGFRKAAVGPCGAADAAVSFGVVGGRMKYDNGVVYSSAGQAVDAETGNLLGRFSGNGIDSFYAAVATDSKAGRVYFVIGEQYQGGPTPELRVFDMKTFLPVGELRLPGVVGRPISLVRWGAHGLAFNTFDVSPVPLGTYRTYVLEDALVAEPSGSFVPAPTPPTPALTIRGQVTSFNGVGGVQINVTGGFTANVVTDSGGNYSITNIPHCADITITPKSDGYTFNPASVHLTNPGGTPRLNFTATPKRVYFPSSLGFVAESANELQVLVRRDGDLSQAATVDYETADGSASSRSDYTAAFGTLRFAPNEATKTVNILITDDPFVEGSENFTIRLKNPSGAVLVPQFDAQTIYISDDDTAQPTTSPLQDARFFVRRQYQDFLNRDPGDDPSGFDFWTGQITACDAETDPQRKAGCVAVRRVNVSAAFFLSIEFQETGYLVHRFYVASYPASSSRPRGLPRLAEFLRDTQEIGRGVVVGANGWEQTLEQNKQAFALRWVGRAEFLAEHPASQSAGQFVDSLFSNADVVPAAEEQSAALAAFGSGGDDGRARALRSVAESKSVSDHQFNSAFVLMQYLGYLRRNPDDAPDGNFDGYDFWLSKLNQFNGNFVQAEMVKAFLASTEYQQRFGPANFDISR